MLDQGKGHKIPDEEDRPREPVVVSALSPRLKGSGETGSAQSFGSLIREGSNEVACGSTFYFIYPGLLIEGQSTRFPAQRVSDAADAPRDR